jgi:hypothetical protein
VRRAGERHGASCRARTWTSRGSSTLSPRRSAKRSPNRSCAPMPRSRAFHHRMHNRATAPSTESGLRSVSHTCGITSQ